MIKRLVITAFNYGEAGLTVNGPGICLVNFVKFLKKHTDISVDVFASQESKKDKVYNILDRQRLKASIQNADILHHWSGISSLYKFGIKYSNSIGKPVILGPNVLDTVFLDQELEFMDGCRFDRVLTVNQQLRHRIVTAHELEADKVKIFLIGPDLEIWRPSGINNGKILWKGNAKHFVKDVNFGLSVAKNLPQYDFVFMGHPNPYNYYEHIEEAKKYSLYFSTSLSETMGMGLAEQLAAGIPAVTHPKIFLHGINYETGIITSRDVDSYCEAINEIMSNAVLHQELSLGATKFMKKEFSSQTTIENYLNIIQEI